MLRRNGLVIVTLKNILYNNLEYRCGRVVGVFDCKQRNCRNKKDLTLNSPCLACNGQLFTFEPMFEQRGLAWKVIPKRRRAINPKYGHFRAKKISKQELGIIKLTVI